MMIIFSILPPSSVNIRIERSSSFFGPIQQCFKIQKWVFRSILVDLYFFSFTCEITVFPLLNAAPAHQGNLGIPHK